MTHFKAFLMLTIESIPLTDVAVPIVSNSRSDSLISHFPASRRVVVKIFLIKIRIVAIESVMKSEQKLDETMVDSSSICLN